MRSRALVVCVAMMLAVVFGWAAPIAARPKEPVTIDAELLTVHATSKGRSVDSRIRGPSLSKAPFSAYSNYTVIKKSGAVLATGMAWKTTLPNGHDLMIGLKDAIVPKRKSKDPIRYVIVASIARTGASAFKEVLQTEALAGDSILIPAEKHKGGLLVVSVRLIKK